MSARSAAEARLAQENEIPAIPSTWQIERFRFLFQESKERNGSEPVGDMLSVSEYRGVVPRQYDDQESKRSDEELENYRVVRPGQLAVNTMWLNHLGLGVSDHLGHVSPAYSVFDISPRLNGRFVHHLLRSQFYLKIYLRYLYGIRPNSFQIKASDWGSMPIIVPPLASQRAIADFLDRETSLIDQLIEKKQRFIRITAEGLAAAIDLALSASEVPKVELVPFKWICRVAEGQVDPTDSEWADKPLIAPNHIESGTGRLLGIETAAEQGAISGKYAYGAGTVLYSKIRPALAKACIASDAGMCSADMYPIIPRNKLRPEFLLMQLLSRKFTTWATLESMRVAMPKINRATLGDYRLWVPSLQKQRELHTAHQRQKKHSEAMIDKQKASIARLSEFRSALITAAVTGRIDVTTWGKQGQTDCRLDQIQEEMDA